MSSESTPVLSHAISSFETFMTEWEKLGKEHEKLRPWTEIGLRWAKKYYIRMDDTDAYIVTMCQSSNYYLLQCFSNPRLVLNPRMRFTHIQEEWERCYVREAKDIILNLVRLHHLSAQFFLTTRRCAVTVTSNRSRLKLQQQRPTPPADLARSLGPNRLQCGSRFPIPTKNRHITSSL